METITLRDCVAQLCIDEANVVVACDALSMELEGDEICAIKCYLSSRTSLGAALRTANKARMTYNYTNGTLYTKDRKIKLICVEWLN